MLPGALCISHNSENEQGYANDTGRDRKAGFASKSDDFRASAAHSGHQVFQ
jgi:hypothetical protein